MICSMIELLKEADKKNQAVGAFSVYSMEMVKGVVEAAEEMETPVILQVAESRFCYAPLELMGPMMLQAAADSKVKIAVHLDHGRHLETIKRALEMGFTSVMLDASGQPVDQNIRMTIQAMEMAAAYGAAVEAEIGCVGGNEGMGNVADTCTKPEEAFRFVRETGVEALAIAIGNAHGNYKQEPRLQFDILKRIHEENDTALVLHGGSGISFEDFRKTIDCGIRKINIATANLDALVAGAREGLKENPKTGYFSISTRMTEKVRECTKTHIQVFHNKA
ncbi:MAG: ketose-bisphosphate aldolase [Lachnospiraceae bacterium]